MLETRCVAFLGRTVVERIQKHFAHGWHEQDVAVIGDAGAAQMCVTEAVDDRIGVVVTGAAVPAGESRVGAELDHAKRPRRAGKRVAMPAGADKRIDVTREVLLRRDLRARQE